LVYNRQPGTGNLPAGRQACNASACGICFIKEEKPCSKYKTPPGKAGFMFVKPVLEILKDSIPRVPTA